MSKEEKDPKILSVKLGTKHLAVAVLEGQDLLYWRNKRIRHKKISQEKALKNLRDILYGLIDFWNPDVIALEEIFYTQSRKSNLLNRLIRGVQRIGKERNIKVYFYSPIEVRKFLCKEEKVNKLNAAKVLANRYPWLSKKFARENQKRWYEVKFGLLIFDAIAVGLFCFYQLKININGKV